MYIHISEIAIFVSSPQLFKEMWLCNSISTIHCGEEEKKIYILSRNRICFIAMVSRDPYHQTNKTTWSFSNPNLYQSCQSKGVQIWRSATGFPQLFKGKSPRTCISALLHLFSLSELPKCGSTIYKVLYHPQLFKGTLLRKCISALPQSIAEVWIQKVLTPVQESNTILEADGDPYRWTDQATWASRILLKEV